MGTMTPFNKQDPELWKQQNKEVIKRRMQSLNEAKIETAVDGKT